MTVLERISLKSIEKSPKEREGHTGKVNVLQYRHILMIACTAGLLITLAACGFKFGKFKDKIGKKELSAHNVVPAKDSEADAHHPPEKPSKHTEQAAHVDTPEPEGLSFFDKANGASREELRACVKFLGGIPSESFVYHMQAKIKSHTPYEERGNYLIPHFKVRRVNAPMSLNAMNVCADTILSMERFAEVKSLSKIKTDAAIAFIQQKQKLSEIVEERYPLRSCGLFLNSIKTNRQFAKTKKEFKETPEEVMAAKLARFNTAGENLQNRTITVRGCLAVLKTFRNLNDLNNFNFTSSAEQFELLTQHAIPVQYAH